MVRVVAVDDAPLHPAGRRPTRAVLVHYRAAAAGTGWDLGAAAFQEPYPDIICSCRAPSCSPTIPPPRTG